VQPSPEPFDADKEFSVLIANAVDIDDLFCRLDDLSQDSAAGIEFGQRKEQLYNFLIDVLRVKYDIGWIITRQVAFDTIDLTATKRDLQQKAKRYLDTLWLHTPSLVALVAVTLIDCELAELVERSSDSKPLKLVRDELSSGSFDTDEIIRRLRYAEQQGYYFSSLVYPLLTEGRIGEPNEEPEQKQPPEADEQPEEEHPQPVWNALVEASNLVTPILN